MMATCPWLNGIVFMKLLGNPCGLTLVSGQGLFTRNLGLSRGDDARRRLFNFREFEEFVHRRYLPTTLRRAKKIMSVTKLTKMLKRISLNKAQIVNRYFFIVSPVVRLQLENLPPFYSLPGDFSRRKQDGR